MLFGLGFDTATEVGLLVLAGGAAAFKLPFYAILVLPVLFAAGMCLLDTIDGVFMNFAYGWAFAKPVRKVFYNITITGALGRGRADHRHHRAGLDPRRPARRSPPARWPGSAASTSTTPATPSSGCSSLTWVVALAVWRFGRIEERWSRHLAPPPSDPLPAEARPTLRVGPRLTGRGQTRRSDGDQLHGADGVAGQDRAGHLRVGAERLGDRDRAGLERELGGPVRQGARAPGTATRPRCGGGPRRGTARTASPVAGGAAEAYAATVGSWCRAPHSRASRATAWLASGSEEPAAASTSASSSRTRASLSARRAAAGRAPPGTPARGRARAVARIRRPSWRAVRLGDARGDVDLGVVGLGQQQRDDDDLVVARRGRAGRPRSPNDGLDELEERRLDAQVGAHAADLVDERLDRLRPSGGRGCRGRGPPGRERS